MKRILTIATLALLCINLNAASFPANWAVTMGDQPEVKALTPEMAQMGLDQFLALTPKKFKETTGKRMTIKQAVQLKVAQKIVKRQMKKDPDISKGLYVLLAIIGLGWVAMGILDNWDGSDWIVNLVLTILCWLPGLIHALVKMKKYYP